jgi:predicted nucleotidyltransferase
MFTKEKDILHKIAEKFAVDRRILKAIVYGSRVRGDFRGDSDFDVMIIVDKKSRELKDKIIDIFYAYELATDMPFSLTIRSQDELNYNEKLGSPFFERIKKEGITFYDSQQRREEDTLKVST